MSQTNARIPFSLFTSSRFLTYFKIRWTISSSTIITMVIVPAVYAAMDKSGSRDKKKILSKQFKFMADFNPERDLPKKK